MNQYKAFYFTVDNVTETGFSVFCLTWRAFPNQQLALKDFGIEKSFSAEELVKNGDVQKFISEKLTDALATEKTAQSGVWQAIIGSAQKSESAKAALKAFTEGKGSRPVAKDEFVVILNIDDVPMLQKEVESLPEVSPVPSSGVDGEKKKAETES
jgi:hypothetical protein